VQRCVALDGLAVDVGADADESLGNPEVALVARNHQASVAVTVCKLGIWKKTRMEIVSIVNRKSVHMNRIAY
jgi:hypothetical protein